MNRVGIFSCTSSTSANWRLPGLLGTPSSVLLGWGRSPLDADDNAPRAVTDVLSQSFFSEATIRAMQGDVINPIKKDAAVSGADIAVGFAGGALAAFGVDWFW